tara:strand:+ start:594 stop:956 length:363 start_codon:yes stop_codon:yes gene_type:complete
LSNKISFTPAIAWGIFVCVMMLLPSENLPNKVFDANDKIVHALSFGLLYFLIFQAWHRFGKSSISKLLRIKILGFCTILGGLIEILQAYVVKGRSGDVYDFIADFLGASLFFLLLKNKKA